MNTEMTPQDACVQYSARLQSVLSGTDWSGVSSLAEAMEECWKSGRQVFFCGNGGSAGNAIHMANDFVYGIAKKTGGGIKATAFSANQSVMTCFANDLGYDSIYSEQVAVFAQAGDILIGLSGRGNSPNIIKAIEQAKLMGVKTYAILGYNGGKCKELADVAIHFPVDDMQIAEDMQLIVGHMLMQWLYSRSPTV
jgi:D-sedoheptulose 7-phosphate isomerase